MEQKAFAQYTLARCTIADGDSSRTSSPLSTSPSTDTLASGPALEAALPLLQAAAQTYEALEMFSAACDVLFLLSVVAHNAGQTGLRDSAATKHATALERREKAHVEVAEPWIEEVWAVVTEVGAALASR